MRTYYGWTITKNKECRTYPWNIYDKDGEYVCSCATLKEAKDSIKASEKTGREDKSMYKGYEIEAFGPGYTVFFEGDEIYFDTEEEAKAFIDQEG